MNNNDELKIPNNLYVFYSENSDKFEEKTNMTKKVIYYGLTALCLLLIIFPSLLPLSSWLVRIVAVIGLVVFGFSAYAGGSNYYNKQSGGIIKRLPIKKFNSSEISEEAILSMFNDNDFEGLATAPAADNQPIQLYIDEDSVGKEFYLQIRKYFSSSDFRGITPVKVIKEPEYTQFYKTIKSI